MILSLNFQDFPEPKWFSRTFQEEWERWKKVFPTQKIARCHYADMLNMFWA